MKYSKKNGKLVVNASAKQLKALVKKNPKLAQQMSDAMLPTFLSEMSDMYESYFGFPMPDNIREQVSSGVRESIKRHSGSSFDADPAQEEIEGDPLYEEDEVDLIEENFEVGDLDGGSAAEAEHEYLDMNVERGLNDVADNQVVDTSEERGDYIDDDYTPQEFAFKNSLDDEASWSGEDDGPGDSIEDVDNKLDAADKQTRELRDMGIAASRKGGLSKVASNDDFTKRLYRIMYGK